MEAERQKTFWQKSKKRVSRLPAAGLKLSPHFFLNRQTYFARPKKIKITNSPQETIALGRRFSRILKEKDVVILEGVLGGGKTTFVRGILQGLGAKARVLSPSFTLLRRYKMGKVYIYHIDLYRIRGKEAFNFGIQDYLYSPRSITLIEWGEKLKACLPSYIEVKFFFNGERGRRIAFFLKEDKGMLRSEFVRN